VGFLTGACGGEDELRREVESLLRAHDKAGKYFAAPAMEVAGGLLAEQKNPSLAPSLIGRSISHYQVLSLLGAGGMGEVFLAEDTRLGRKVALKVLPAAFTGNPERVRRFEREAKAASALNQPNILTIHEIGEIDNCHFIVSEYVEGETLRQRMKAGKLAWSVALDVALQVASALAAAHAAGITHRDIKPENVMVRPDGLVKALDFGLAKLTETQLLPVDSQASTLIKLSTEPGVVMGTISYMSPEQARGEEVDGRSDIFSFGVVLYEMLSGCHPFTRDSQAETISAILTCEPPLDELSDTHTQACQAIVRKCLAKDRGARYQTAKELLFDLQTLQGKFAAPTQPPAEAGSIVWQRWAMAVVVVGLLVLAAAWLWLGRPRGAAVEKVEISKTEQITTWTGLDNYPALAPDGNSIAYASDHSGSFEIYVKPLTAGGREIQLTTDGQQNFQPAFSRDGKFIAFYSRNRGGIWTVPASGGKVKQLSPFGSRPAWSPDGSLIAFQSASLTDLGALAVPGQPPSTIWVVPSNGSAESTQITQVGNPPGGHGVPTWSPDGKRIVLCAADFGNSSIWSVTDKGGDAKQITKVSMVFDPVYAPDGESIYYGTLSGLWKIRVSATSGEPMGEPVKVTSTSSERIRHFSVSADGKKIAYAALLLNSNIWSVTLTSDLSAATGTPSPLTQDRALRHSVPAFSPDGKRIAFNTQNVGREGLGDIWLMDADGRSAAQITTESGGLANWFPDGEQLAFHSARDGRKLWITNLKTGQERPLLDFGEQVNYLRLSPDGKQIAFNSKRSGTTNVWTIAVGGGAAKPLTFDKEFMGFPFWSPDSKTLGLQIKRGDDTHLAVMPSAGGAITQLTFDKGQSWNGGFSPDGDKILFAGQRGDFWNLYWVSRSTRQQRQITSYTKLNAYVRYPAWSPVGNQIAYEYTETTGNIWMIELK
jgi:Tol biopolymer transport system component